MTPIRVVLADDHQLVREGIRQVLLTGDGTFEVAGEAGDGPTALRLAETLRPDVLVLDVSLPGRSGIEVAQDLSARGVAVRILMLSVHDHRQYVIESVRAGAQGYLRKDTDPQELRHAIRAVASGETFYSPAVARHLAAALRGDAHPPSPAEHLASLTRRERQVLKGIANGATNRQIAADLRLSVRTVESYRESLMRKLGIYSVAGLTRLVLEAEEPPLP